MTPSSARPGEYYERDVVGWEAQAPEGVQWACQPTRDVVEHKLMLTRLLVRQWCPYCVKGRAVKGPHQTRADEGMTPGATVIGMAYCWAKEKVVQRCEDGGSP